MLWDTHSLDQVMHKIVNDVEANQYVPPHLTTGQKWRTMSVRRGFVYRSELSSSCLKRNLRS